MASASFGTSSKRENSTQIPTLGTSLSVNLKGGSSVIRPAFLVAVSDASGYNYMSYKGRYYRITDIKSVRDNLWEVSGKVDVLATYKTAVGATQAFILYASSQAVGHIPDRRLTAKTQATVSQQSQSLSNIGAGVTAIVHTTGTAGCAAYALSQSSASGLLARINSWMDNVRGIQFPTNPTWTDVPTVLGAIYETLISGIRQMISTGNAADCIRAARLVPVAGVSGPDDNIYLGDYDTRVSGIRVYTSARTVTETVAFSINWNFPDWRRLSPFTRLYLKLPFIGTVELNTADLNETAASTLYVKYTLDVLSGDLVVLVSTLDHTLHRFTGNVAISYDIGASNTTPVSVLNSLASGAVHMAAAFSNPVSAAGIVGDIAGLAATPTTVSGSGGGAALNESNTVELVQVCNDTVCTPDSVRPAIGAPVMAVGTVSSYSGYIQTKGASVSASGATAEEISELNTLLDGGIFYE